MNKRIEGTFADYEDLKETINTMLAQGFAAKQLLVLTRNEEGHRLEEDTTVEVKVTTEQDESLWDKIVSFFTVDLDNDDDDDDEEEVDEEDIFEEYGIDEDTYERFEEALENGEYLLLIDDAPPAQQEHSQFLVRDGIIPKEEDSMNNDKTPKSAKPDWTNTDDEFNGDVEKHTMDAAGKDTSGVKSASAHPDPIPGETEADNVQAEIPKSQHPDPIVDDEGNEIPVDPDMMEEVGGETVAEEDSFDAEHQAAHPDPEPGVTESDDVVTEIPQSAHPDPVVYDEDDEATTTDDAPTSAEENPDLEEDTTGEPVEAEDPHGDPTMADENTALEPMQFDEVESHPEIDEDNDSHISRDPFGGDTVEGEDGSDVEPKYEETDKEPPAL